MKKNLIFILIFTFFLILIFFNKEIIFTSASNSLILWQTKVYPSLFIMFIIQDLLINYNAAYYLNYILYNLFSKIFGISINGQMAFTLSLVSGSPTNAYILNELVKTNKISTNEANHILQFSYFANPLFLYTMLSFIFDDHTPLKIISILYLSNILLGISIKKTKYISTDKYQLYNDINFGNILTNAIKKSINTLLMILGSITFFMIISNLINSYIDNEIITTIISGLFEITASLNKLINLNVSNSIKEILSIVIISFGGLSIHSQIFSIIQDSKLSYKYFLKGRLYATLIALVIVISI